MSGFSVEINVPYIFLQRIHTISQICVTNLEAPELKGVDVTMVWKV